MSNDIIIRARDVGKCYRIGLREEIHDTFGGMLLSWIRSPATNYRRLRKLTSFGDVEGNRGESPGPATGDDTQPDDILWALRNVSFDVRRGEVLGIIGRNGAGKSTLLKILSRITDLTTGRIDIHGRIASLLEVGTGFHPELTGRDNVYLNGTILGMTKKEVDARFDEIVDFSGVEKFIDTPVKRFSSGMRVRLAFSVAAHLEPEILLVDEVLAVGDFAFQKKCLGKMKHVAGHGRTVLFVSHNMGAVRQLCPQVCCLDKGRVTHFGPYLKNSQGTEDANASREGMCLTKVEFLVSPKKRTDVLFAGGSCIFRVHYDTGNTALDDVKVTMAIYDLLGTKAVQFATSLSHEYGALRHLKGNGYFDCSVDRLHLTSGQYELNVAINGHRGSEKYVERFPAALTLRVLPSDFYGPCRMSEDESGYVLAKHSWRVSGS